MSAKQGKWELYNLDRDRTELNDLAARQPERVASMQKEWFRIAKDVDRLGGKALGPAGDKVKDLNFRKDTSSGSASSKRMSRRERRSS